MTRVKPWDVGQRRRGPINGVHEDATYIVGAVGTKGVGGMVRCLCPEHVDAGAGLSVQCQPQIERSVLLDDAFAAHVCGPGCTVCDPPATAPDVHTAGAFTFVNGEKTKHPEGTPLTALQVIQARKKPEPWRPSVDDWDLLPDAGR